LPKSQAYCPTDSPASTGDQSDLTFQSHNLCRRHLGKIGRRFEVIHFHSWKNALDEPL
jgi:hypothetical protein